MPLVSCKDCQQEFSTDAKRCPQCGAKKSRPPKRSWKQNKTLNILAGLFLLGLFMQAFTPKSKTSTQIQTPEQIRLSKRVEDLNTAKYYCREQISKSLNDPASAQYVNKYTVQDYGAFVKSKDGKVEMIEVQTSLRAKNAFGAIIMKTIECDYIYTSEGKTIPMAIKGLN